MWINESKIEAAWKEDEKMQMRRESKEMDKAKCRKVNNCSRVNDGAARYVSRRG